MEGLLVVSAGEEVRLVKAKREAQTFKREKENHVLFEI